MIYRCRGEATGADCPDLAVLYFVGNQNFAVNWGNTILPALAGGTEVSDLDNNGIPDVMFKFDRRLV
jgi:hypothetical protein